MKTNLRIQFAALTILLSTTNSQFSTSFAQGNLTPPGAPAPTMKTLDQIEPRTPISSITFSISQPGSYYLTTNLTAVSGHGIIISASNVALDLNGFTLAGVPGAVDGIFIGSLVTNVVVRNGTIRNWPGYGVRAEIANFFQIQDVCVLNTC